MNSKSRMSANSPTVQNVVVPSATAIQEAVETTPSIVDSTVTAAASIVDSTVTAAASSANAVETTAAEIARITINPTTGMKKAMKTTEDFVAFGQGNIEAYMKASQIWTAGIQDLSKQFAATAQSSFNDSMATFKAMSSVKSVKDAVELQTALARSTIEKTLAESGKLTDASLKLTEQAMAPISARVAMAVDTFSKVG